MGYMIYMYKFIIREEYKKGDLWEPLTSPPLSFNPMTLGCRHISAATSTGRSIPVLAGTLYRITGTGLASATCHRKTFVFLGLFQSFFYWALFCRVAITTSLLQYRKASSRGAYGHDPF